MKYRIKLLLLFVMLSTLALSAVAHRGEDPYGKYGFEGSVSKNANGDLTFSMRDGTAFSISKTGRLSISTIGDTNSPTTRLDPFGRIIFAATSNLAIIYMFRYTPGGKVDGFTDYQAKYLKFIYSPQGSIARVYFPDGSNEAFSEIGKRK